MKKLTAILMALLMLAMPFAGLAEESLDDYLALFAAQEEMPDSYIDEALAAGRRINTTVALTNVANEFVGDPTIDKVIADVLKALHISSYQQGDEGYFALGMKQPDGNVVDILTMGAATADGNAYIASNLLGGTIVISGNEVETLINRLLDMFVKAGMLEQADVNEIKAMLPEMVSMVKAELEAAKNQAELDITKLNFDALLNAFLPMLEKVETSEVTMQPKNCDFAATMLKIEYTNEDMKNMFTGLFQFIKDNPEFAALVEKEMDFPTMAAQIGFEGTFNEFLDTAMAEVQDEELLTSNIPMTLWLDENDMPVAGEVVIDDVAFNYTRLTMNQGPTHSFVLKAGNTDVTLNMLLGEKSGVVTLAVAENGANVLDMSVNYADLSNEVSEITDVDIAMTIEGITLNLAVDSKLTKNGVDFVSVDEITFGINGTNYATLTCESKTASAGASIMTTDVIRPAELNDADFANWFVNTINNLTNWLYNALFALPSSVLDML